MCIGVRCCSGLGVCQERKMLGFLLRYAKVGSFGLLVHGSCGFGGERASLEVLRRTIRSREVLLGEDGSLSGRDSSGQGETDCRYEL